MKSIVLYCGLSVNNTPKLNAVKQSLAESLQGDCELVALIKHNEDVQGKLFVIGDYSGIPKLLRVAYLLLCMLVYLLLRQRSVKMIYAVNPLAGLIALVVTKLRGGRYYYETHEIFCGLNYQYFDGKWRIFWWNIEKVIIENSAYFFATDQYRLRFLRRYYKIRNPNIGYIYNVPLVRSTGAVDVGDLRENGRFKFLLSYCGGVDESRDIETIIRAFALLDRQDICLYLVGNCPAAYEQKLWGIANELGIESRLRMTGKVKNDVLQSYMAESDITFAFYQRNSLNNRLCSPNKVFDAIYAGVPFISSQTPLTKMISRMGVGIVINTVNPECAAEAVKLILSDLQRFDADSFAKARLIFSWGSEGKKIVKAVSGCHLDVDK